MKAARTHKHFQLDGSKIKRAQKVFGAKTESSFGRSKRAIHQERNRNP
jgi:hypothetical protein